MDLTKRLNYLELDQNDTHQALYRIISRENEQNELPDAVPAFIPLSQIFRDFTSLQNSNEIGDFSYFEPSLHHAFVAISSEQNKL